MFDEIVNNSAEKATCLIFNVFIMKWLGNILQNFGVSIIFSYGPATRVSGQAF